MLKRVDNAVIKAFNEAGDDATFTPGLTVLGLDGDYVGYAVDEYNKDLVTAEDIAALDALKAQIVSGEVEVHDYTTDGSCPL
jgi:basic membrane protein A